MTVLRVLPAVAGLLLGCLGDNSAYLGARPTLAVGTFGELAFSDKCAASKANLCFTDTVREVSFTVDSPSVLEVLPVSSVPSELTQQYMGQHMLHGLAPGRANVCGEGTFSDGTHRKACAIVEVKAIDHVALSFNCDQPVDGDNTTPAPLVPAGAVLMIRVQLVGSDGNLLDGTVVHPLDDAQLASYSPMSYVWSSPAAGGTLTLTSPLDAKFAETLETYGPDRVTAAVAATEVVSPTIVGYGVPQVRVAEDVGGRRACLGLPVAARSDTPDVCTGPNGETAWMEATRSYTSFTGVKEGTCRLSIGVAGGNGYLTTIETFFYMRNPADQDRDAYGLASCPTDGQKTCAISRDAILVCRGHQWVVDSSCDGKLCDYTMPAASCTGSTVCVACR